MTSHVIRRISATETYPLRGAILRAGLPPECSIFPQDEAPETIHLGAFQAGKLVGITSLYMAPLPERSEEVPAWQLRGMATLPEVRGLGFGGELVRTALALATEAQAALLWCNARSPAASFYKKHGLQTLGSEFEIPTAGPHFRMWVALR